MKEYSIDIYDIRWCAGWGAIKGKTISFITYALTNEEAVEKAKLQFPNYTRYEIVLVKEMLLVKEEI